MVSHQYYVVMNEEFYVIVLEKSGIVRLEVLEEVSENERKGLTCN